MVEFEVSGKRRTFRIFTYQAYNAGGMIGPEFNGIAIADHDRRQLVCDGIKPQASGYFGASQAQVDEWERICGLDWPGFCAFVNAQPSKRMTLDVSPRKPIQVKVPPMSDSKFMTARQKEGVVRDWVRFVAGGFRQEDFTKALYLHLTNNCSFIAHYDRMGFYQTYFSAPEDTLWFLSQFDRSQGCASVEYGDSHWLTQDGYADVNAAMVDLIAGRLQAIRAVSRQAEVELAKAGVVEAQARLARAERQVA